MAPEQTQSAQPTSRKAPTSKKGRNFFHKVEPTFAIKPSATQLEFVDNSDPSKDIVVRKKAREWVHRNREASIRRKNASGSHTFRVEDSNKEQRDSKSRAAFKASLRALFDPSSGRIDPFDVLPNVGRKVDHIIEFYHATRLLRIHFLTLSIVLTQCPEEVPCSDDKYAWRARRSDLSVSNENTVLGTMATERVSFILWLYATTVIRDGMAGNWDSEECFWYYKLSLQTMREESKRRVTEFTDSFIAALACFTAVANFAGQYKAAEMHRNAMIQAIVMKGDGNLIEGLRKCKPWTQKAVVWCEIHVAAQIPEPPKLPYMPPPQNGPLPHTITVKAERLTEATLSNLPAVSDPLPEIVQQLHLLSVSQYAPPSSFGVWPAHHKIDPTVIRPLYCAEYTLICTLSRQQKEGHGFTPFEVMFSEACQVYIWTAVRGLPPQMKMCDLFIERLKKALLPLLEDSQHPVAETPPSTAASVPEPTDAKQGSTTPENPPLVPNKPKSLDSVFEWVFFLGTLVSSVGPRPEYSWFREQLLHQLFVKNPGKFKSGEDLKCVLKMFPYTEAFCGSGVAKLNIPF